MSKLLKLYPAFILGSALLPLVAGAQQLNTILNNVGQTLRNVIGVLFVLATVIFLWGVIQFIAKSGVLS
ncbi:MAG: hypothetical protein HYW91_02190 [Candidatus Sungbacteria bacterium]|nr:hypothetical protein [Candidatus Sungbacteria bacterium]